MNTPITHTGEENPLAISGGMVSTALMEPAMILDTSLHILEWNAMCEAVYGRSAQMVIGKPFFAVFPETAGNTHFAIALQQALLGNPFFIAAAEGTSQGDFDHDFLPLKNPEGRATGILYLRHDRALQHKAALEYRQLCRELARKEAALVQLQAAFQELCAATARCIYQPLRRVYHFASLLLLRREEHFSAEGMGYMNRIRAASAQLNQMVADLLTFSALDRVPEKSTDIDLNDLFWFLKNNLAVQISESGATLHWEMLPSMYGARVMLHDLFKELLSNALRFRQEGILPVISITAGQTAIEALGLDDQPSVAQYMWVSIADNGIGFDEAEGPDLFRLFYRSSRARAYPGNGLGLAICRKTVERFHGTISNTSIGAGGSTFTVYLPLEMPAKIAVA